MHSAGLIRAALAALVAVVLWVTAGAGTSTAYLAYLAVVLAAVYGLALSLSGWSQSSTRSASSGLLTAMADSVLISLLVASTGGVESPFSALYLLAAFRAAWGHGFTASAAIMVSGYLAAAAIPEISEILSGSIPVTLALYAGLNVMLILLASLLSGMLASRLDKAQEDSASHAASLDSERVYAERLQTAFTSLETPLGLLRQEDVLQWAVETARETVGAAYAHAALLEGNLHRTAAEEDLTSCPSWWHPNVQRLVLWSYKTGQAMREESGPQGMESMGTLLSVPMTLKDTTTIGTLLVAGPGAGEDEKQILRRIASEAADALSARDASPGGRDPVTRLPNRASLMRILWSEKRRESRLALLRLGLDGLERYREINGLSAAEDLLRQIGGRLGSVQHRVFYAGAEEFILLLSGDDSRVRRAILASQEAVAETTSLTARVGVSRFRDAEDRELDPDEALEAAGRALDRARKSPEGVAYAEEIGETERVSGSSGVVSALVEAAEAHETYLGDHLQGVSRLARSLGEQLGLSGRRLEDLAVGALLHDVGKIGLPQSLLDKPGALDLAEYETIKLHPELGVKILEPVEELSHVLPLVKHHHERYDGNGYPDGLEGEGIPLGARITLVADALDSMTRDRSYRKGLALEHALQEISDGSGSQFDPEVVSSLLELMDPGRNGEERGLRLAN